MKTKKLNILVFLSILFLVEPGIKAMSEAAGGVITGIVNDSESDDPLEFATVAVYDADSSLISGLITEEDGSFDIRVPDGHYYLVVQFLSYEDKSISDLYVSPGNRKIDLGEIILQQDARQINEVTITGEKSSMVIHLDKKTFNVGKDLGNAGKSAAEILDNIPSVEVDLDGNVNLRGNQNVQILVNGKPSGLVSNDNPASLRSMQGSMIDRVEVVTNPSARYQAEGMSGIINIVLKKDQKKGVNGSFEGSAGYPHSYRAGANVNFRRENLNYFLNYGSSFRERPGEGRAFQQFMFPDTSYRTEVERNRLRSGWSHNFRGGADWFINPRNTLTAAAFVGLSNDRSSTDLFYRDFGQNGELHEVTWRQDNEKENERNMEFSLDYTLVFAEEGRKLNVFSQYIEEGELEKSDIRELMDVISGEALDDDPILQQAVNEGREKEFLIQADYIHPFGEKGNFESGYRSDLRFISNPYTVEEQDDMGDWVSLPNFTNSFQYRENIHAVYTQAGNHFNRWNVQLGLRAELSDVRTYLVQTGERNDRLYFNFFPTIHTGYQFNQLHSAQVSYSRRINRPHFYYLNPFSSFTDPRNIRMGNPDLEPEFTDSYEAGYLMNNGKTSLYTGGYWRHTTGVIERISEVDAEGVTYILPANLSVQNSYGVEANLSVDPVNWWTMSGDVNAFRAITSGEYKGENLESDDYSWNGRLNSMMRFRNNFDIQTTYYYRAPQRTTQGERLSYSMMNLGISKDVLEGNGTLTLNFNDIFNTRAYRYVIDRPNLYSENEYRRSSRSVSLAFIYRLNQDKKRGDRQRGGGFDGGGDMGI